MRILGKGARAAAVASVLVLGLSGCDYFKQLGQQFQQGWTPGPGTTGLLSLMAGANTATLYRGTRFHRVTYGDPQNPSVESWREDVASDGLGNYMLQVTQWLQPALPPAQEALQLQLLGLREGFLFRYGGFAVRDLMQLTSAWSVIDPQVTVTVAGITGNELQFQLNQNAQSRWRVVVEPTTGLVLKATEEDLAGTVLQEEYFETLSFTPDLSGVVWHVPGNSEVSYGLQIPPGTVSFPLLEPALLPQDYRLIDAATLVEPGNGRVWVKQTYSDGVEVAFLVYATTIGDPPPSAADADQVRCVDYGSWTVLDGAVRDYYVIAAGTASVTDLTQMLQSALPPLQ